MALPRLKIEDLSPEDRIRLAEELWDSLAPEEIPLTATQERELDRRVAAYREDHDPGQPWKEALAEIRKAEA